MPDHRVTEMGRPAQGDVQSASAFDPAGPCRKCVRRIVFNCWPWYGRCCMYCTNCGFENRTGARFCELCGAMLVRTCPRCGHDAGPSARFCGACGASLAEARATPSLSPESVSDLPPAPIHYTPQHLAERIRAEQAAMEARGETAGERKTVTALFADMAGSTALIHNLDEAGRFREARRVPAGTARDALRGHHREDRVRCEWRPQASDFDALSGQGGPLGSGHDDRGGVTCRLP
ncbi:protein of unknown function [Burkholderia multivorans]